jgi:hypothetical protein
VIEAEPITAEGGQIAIHAVPIAKRLQTHKWKEVPC